MNVMKNILIITLGLLAFFVSFPVYSNDDLESAYRKEFAFLGEQKRNLEKRLSEFRQAEKKETGGLERDIDRLSEKLLFLETETERSNELVLESERMIENVQDNSNLFDTTFEQAKISFLDLSIDFQDDETAASDDRLAKLFDKTLNALDQLGEVRTDSGSYFDKGEKIDAEILYIGRVAAFGLHPEHIGALAPVGDGKLQIWEKPAVDTAKALAGNQPIDELELFLFESNSKGVDFTDEEGLIDYIESGGLIAWIIVLLGVAGVVLVVFRFTFLKKSSTANDQIIESIGSYVSKGEIDQAINACAKESGSAPRVVQSVLRNLDRDRDHLEDIISESILHESSVLNRFGAFIIVIAAVSPLLGLLGTVTGMIATFDIITEFGTGDPKLLSGGISTALVTTQLGLVVAIPILIMGNLLSGWSNRIKDEMEKSALKVVNIYDARTAPAV